METLHESRVRETTVAPASDGALLPSVTRKLPSWTQAAVPCGAVAGLAVFFASLPGVDLASINGLGLLSVLPVGVIAGVVLISLAFMLGIALPEAHPVRLGTALVGLVVCLDGITAFIEPEPRFATAYQIAGYVQYLSTTGHAAPGLAAYFSWPGFFALVSLVAGAAGTHGLLTLLRVWPVVINLLCLPPLFLLMRSFRVSWRAQWLAAFFFVVGNWVGQDYFSPQSFDFLLYILFVAILLNWFTDQDGRRAWRFIQNSRVARVHRQIFGALSPGERPPRPATTGQKTFLLLLLIGLFTVVTASHQLTPFFVIGACVGLVVARRLALPGLPVLFAVILAGYISFATVGYWSGHLSNVVGGIGHLGSNVNTSVGGRLRGNTATHLIVLHARVELALAIVGFAALGFLRRRQKGWDDRILFMLVVMPVVLVGVVSYGGEIALRTYLFLLPAACLLAALLFFPRPRAIVPSWRTMAVLGVCALVFPIGFLLARYGNEAYEQVPPGELAATNWVYAHDADGVRLLWLSTSPSVDVTPQMPWDYRDLSKVAYLPTLAPRDPTRVSGLITALHRAGPGSYLIATRTQIAAMQETASYPADWGSRFHGSMKRAPDVRVAFATNTAVVYTLHWPAGARPRPLALNAVGPTFRGFGWTELGLIVLGLLAVLLATGEVIRLRRRSARVVRLIWLASLPLFILLLGDIILRFVVLS